MAVRPVLVSWIGHADLAAMCLDLPEQERAKIRAAVKLPMKDVESPGPLKTAVLSEDFAEVHLLSNYPEAANQAYTKWLDRPAAVHPVALSDPSDYGQVFAVSNSVLQAVTKHLDETRQKLCILLTPGTPAMAVIWVLLGRSRYPATFLQAFRGTVKPAKIPDELFEEIIPELIRDRDLNLQHLAASKPSEVPGFKEIIGDSQAIRVAAGRAQRAALRGVPVLILGETGTGKELFAQAIHKASSRRDGPFEEINCAAIPRELQESELFGHEKGAFTGAVSRRDGAFKRANGGTLFLDEIGECDPLMQSKLLRVLQPPSGKGPCHCEFRPMAAGKPVVCDVRILAATNRNLVQEVKAHRFREDLYYRLAVITLRLPPLRERKRDIPLLAEAFLYKINEEFRGEEKHEPGYRDKSLSASATEFVKRYVWPGNVRQLHNALVQAAVMVEGDVIERRDLVAAMGELSAGSEVSVLEHPLGDGFDLEERLKLIQGHYLRRAMEESRGVKAEAARLLGYKNYQTLAAQLDRLGVKWSAEPDGA